MICKFFNKDKTCGLGFAKCYELDINYCCEVFQLQLDIKNFEQELAPLRALKEWAESNTDGGEESLRLKNFRLEQENKELKDKLEHIKIFGHGDYYEIRKQIQELKEHLVGEPQWQKLKCFQSLFQTYIEFIDKILLDELEKTENLCLMCDGVNKYIKYEDALSKIKLNLDYSSIEQLPERAGECLLIIEKALEMPTAKQAAEKAESEFEKYENKSLRNNAEV